MSGQQAPRDRQDPLLVPDVDGVVVTTRPGAAE